MNAPSERMFARESQGGSGLGDRLSLVEVVGYSPLASKFPPCKQPSGRRHGVPPPTLGGDHARHSDKVYKSPISPCQDGPLLRSCAGLFLVRPNAALSDCRLGRRNHARLVVRQFPLPPSGVGADDPARGDCHHRAQVAVGDCVMNHAAAMTPVITKTTKATLRERGP